MANKYSRCPRCGLDEVTEVEGWTEYGDQLVEITRLGCLSCGWVEDEDGDDQIDEWDLT